MKENTQLNLQSKAPPKNTDDLDMIIDFLNHQQIKQTKMTS